MRVQERAACALLKQRFEAAGFTIEEHRPFDEEGVRFEIDGFDSRHRVGYEYATDEAGDSWDVDDAVIAALEERRKRGELHVLIVREADAPDAGSLGRAADAFLAELRERGVSATKPADTAPAVITSPQPAASHAVAPSHSAPAEASSEPAQTIAIPDETELEPAQAIEAMEEVQATERTHAEPAHAEPAHPIAIPDVTPSEPAQAIAVMENAASHAEPEPPNVEPGSRNVNTEPQPPAASGKSRAKTPRSSTSKPKSSKPKPPPAAAKKPASKKVTRK